MHFQTEALKDEPVYFQDELHRERYWGGRTGVLDIGCSVGRTLPDGWVGIDNDAEAIQVALSRGKLALLGRAESLPWFSNDCAGVQCLQVLEHLREPEKAVREFYRVLVRGGMVLIEVPNIRKVRWGFWDYYSHWSPFTRDSLGQLMLECGFRDVKVSYGYISLWGSKTLNRWGLLSIPLALKIQRFAYHLGLRDRRLLVGVGYK